MSVVVLTGAGRGIGRETALRLARAGHRLGLTARTATEVEETAGLVTRLGGEALAVAADVASRADVDRLCARVEQELGPVQGLVNCAGYYGECEPFMTSDPDVWWRAVETNLRGPMLLMRRLLPGMTVSGEGRVVNLSTRMAFDTEASVPFTAYGVSKGALLRLSSLLAAELAGTGVSVFDLSPGLVRTAMSAGMTGSEEWPEEVWLPPSAVAEQVAALLSGRYDVLGGHFVHVRDDLDELAAAVAQDRDRRTLVLTRAGSGDHLGEGRGLSL